MTRNGRDGGRARGFSKSANQATAEDTPNSGTCSDLVGDVNRSACFQVRSIDFAAGELQGGQNRDASMACVIASDWIVRRPTLPPSLSGAVAVFFPSLLNWESIRSDHPLAGYRTKAWLNHAIFAVNVADTHNTGATQFIVACQLADSLVSEHSNRMAGRIKSQEILGRTVAVSSNSLPVTVDFRHRSHRPVILTGCDEDATRSERAYRGKWCSRSGRRSDNQEPRPFDWVLILGSGT